MTEDTPRPAGAEPVDEATAEEQTPPEPARRAWVWPPHAIPILALLLVLAAGTLLPAAGFLSLGRARPSGASDLHAAITRLGDSALVVIDIDADLGTYPEIRYATRAALADLVASGARLGVVSFSPEGRAIALAEIQRLRDLGLGDDRLADLGFRTGGEAALVQMAGSGIGPQPAGPVADAFRSGGLKAAGLALVIGGGEMGPRTWIEQVQPRIRGLRIASITPTFLLPEVQPYRQSGQLVAAVSTLPQATAYGALVAGRGGGGAARFTERPLSVNALLLGMLIAIGVLAASSAGSLATWFRSVGRGGR